MGAGRRGESALPADEKSEKNDCAFFPVFGQKSVFERDRRVRDRVAPRATPCSRLRTGVDRTSGIVNTMRQYRIKDTFFMKDAEFYIFYISIRS